MCGICGIYNIEPENQVKDSQINQMNAMMIHRGPDAGGIFIKDNIGLGHRRLKIIDLEGGVQPMFSPDNNIVVVFNGEIYNFREIKKNLESKGYVFKTGSDTEVIIYAYIEYGEACVDHFRGMFGIAIYDKRHDRLFLIRDRLGIKPLYFYKDDKQFIFSSEIKPICEVLKNKPGVRLASLDFYMSVGYVPGKDTMFDGIKKLLPGHTLLIDKNTFRFTPYWDLQDLPSKDISFSQAMEEFEELLKESVSLRLMSDVPLGAFLSGGLDSSAIVSYMSEQSSSPVKTFSVGYRDDPESSELGYAKIISDYFKTDHHEFYLEPMDFFNSIDTLINYTEEPIVESAAIALYQLSKLAKEHVTVILSGEGGDEILAGYPLHQIMPKIDRAHKISKFIPQNIFNIISSSSEKKLKYLDWLNKPLSKRYQSISNDVTLRIKNNMYKSDYFLESHKMTCDYYEKIFSHLSSATNLRRMTYSDIKSWLPDDLLVKADKMTMAASLELRVPLLDHKLVEYTSLLPDNFRLNGNQGKHLLKKVMEKHIPHEIIYRKKKGFPVPIANWFRSSLYEKTREILLDDSSLNRGYFKPEYIEGMLSRHKDGSEDLSRRIFTMLNLELWHRKYIDQ
ncbi:Asparagine synthetase [glutamine-hydrolyzing] [hydrothermal vent metagenome]|uniref:Asparagine synthetase [glutamine-hydrolyzing] n=1 Tax=hydrothermal vent metagenome TaxID=652676 RepID=A0A3B0XE36_9ZZZZ